MTREPDLIGLIEGYLDDFEGHTPLPDASRDAIRARLPSTPQRPAWWPGWRFLDMNIATRYALGAAAAVLVAIIGFTVLNGGTGNFGSADPTVTPDPTISPEPTVSALSGQVPLAPGRYTVLTGIDMQVTAAVPENWSAVGNWAVRGPRGEGSPDGMGLRFYTVGNLLNNPGSYADGLQDPPVGPTVEDLIQAIVEQEEWTSSSPTELTIGGFAAQHVRITIPDGAEFDPRDDGGAFYLFQDEGAGQIWGLEVGQMFDVYVVDVNGERLVLDAFHYPGTSAAHLAALEAVVDSIQISSN
jgi:hypothetical protein